MLWIRRHRVATLQVSQALQWQRFRQESSVHSPLRQTLLPLAWETLEPLIARKPIHCLAPRVVRRNPSGRTSLPPSNSISTSVKHSRRPAGPPANLTIWRPNSETALAMAKRAAVARNSASRSDEFFNEGKSLTACPCSLFSPDPPSAALCACAASAGAALVQPATSLAPPIHFSYMYVHVE